MKKYLALLILLFAGGILFGQSTMITYPNSSACKSSVTIDAGDTIWTGSSSSGLQKCFNDTCISYTTLNSGISGNRCQAVSVDSANNIWAGSRNGISVFDHVSWQNYNTLNSGLSNDTINAILHNAAGTWIGTNNGLCFFDGTNWTIYNTQNSGIYSNSITDIAYENGILYTAHFSGISQFNGTWTTWPVTDITDVEVVAGRLWYIGNNPNSLKFLDQNTFVNYDTLLNEYSPRTPYYIEYASRKGLTKDKSGNLLFLENPGGQYSIINISPSLKIQESKLTNTTGFFGPQTRIIYKNNQIFGTSFLSGLKKVTVDTSTYHPVLNPSNDFLDVNNATVKILNRGDMHWDPVSQVPQYFSSTTDFKNPVYCSAIWLGGIDQGGQLHTSAMTYRQQGSWDFWTGPLDTINGVSDSATSAYYDRFWKIDYDMIQSFQINYLNGNLQNGTYTLPEAIATWPAHGTGNYSRKLAPFIDVNNDGVYNPYDGDYPELTGHQMLWWVYNDTLSPFVHTETGGRAFQYEIHGKAYGFNCNLNSPVDEVMNYTTFYQYEIINRSQNTYHDAYIGLWTDFDLGNAADDYVACDTMLNTYYCYNGDNDDDGGYGYGLNPPMMNVSVLKGPVSPTADGLDNNHNGVIDETNETTGLSSFMFYVSTNNVPNSNPTTASGYYGYTHAVWLDSVHVTYGETGRNPANPQTNYMFSGTPYSTGWTMATVGILPDDMRGVGSSGPFAIGPGESQTIDFAYIYTRDSINPNGLTTSIAKNTADVQKIINGFNSGNYPCLTSVGVPQLATKNLDFSIYPNPTSNSIYFNKEMLGATYEIYTITGQLVKKGIFSGSAIPLDQLQSQLYIVKAVKENRVYVKRFVKM